MSITLIDKHSGKYQISTNFSINELEAMALSLSTRIVQLVKPLLPHEIELLERIVFSKRQDIELRIFGHYTEVCDLSFLEKLPLIEKISIDCIMQVENIEVLANLKNLEQLNIGIYNLENFDFLNDINHNLKSLCLQKTKTSKNSLENISRFNELEYLYLENQQKNIEVINQLKKIRQIVLRSITTDDLSYLYELPNVWSVDIKLGGIKNFEALTTLPKLKYLELWQIRNLNDLSFISKLNQLQNLFIQSLNNVKVLPNFSNCNLLRRIYLENLKDLKDLSSLEYANNLEEFIYVLAANQNPEDILPVLKNKHIKSVLCKFGSDKKNKKFVELSQQFNKQQYCYSDFIYN